MVTPSEAVATTIIWILAAFGGFFSIRAAWRRRKARRNGRHDIDRK